MKNTYNRFYNFLFILVPWFVMAGMLQVNFQKFLPYQRVFKGLNFFDYFTVTDIFITFVVGVFAIGMIKGTIKFNERKLPAELKIAALLLLAAGVLQIAFQKIYEPVLSTPTEYFRMLFIYPLIFTVLVFRTLDDEAVAKIVKSYIIMVLFFCVLALTQYLIGIFPGEQYDFTKRLVWPFVDFLTLKSSSANWAAFFVTPALILSFIKVFDCFKRARFDTEYLIFNATLFLSAITLYLTQSYGAFVAVFVAIALFLFRALKTKGFIIAFVILLVAAGGVYAMQASTYKYKILTNQVNYKYDNSAASRGDIMKMNLAMIGAHPLLGVGLNQYQSYFAVNHQAVLGHKYGESQIPPHAHNFFLSMWTSLGFLGFLGMLVLAVGLLWRSGFKPDHPAVFVFVAIMVHGLIDSYYWHQETAYIFWMVVAFSYLYNLSSKKTDAK
jgi:O-antigen ligase